jgi:phosphomannomutase/phosphoglucomutase
MKGIKRRVKTFNPLPDYIRDLYNYIDVKEVKKKNNLNVVIDTGAGAGKVGTPKILRELGCNLKLINNELLVKELFPREIEPIKNNLTDLIMEVWQNKIDVGFALDSDADRLAIIGDDAVCYPEDIGIALITEDYFKKYHDSGKEMIFITNLASSLRFEVLAEKYSAQVIRTPVGERFLAEKIYSLIEEDDSKSDDRLIFGGEGSCGGLIYPYFNNTRDGIFAAAKIVEILVKTGRKLSDLVSNLPKYYSHREKININYKEIKTIITRVKEELVAEGEEVEQFDSDLRFGKGKEWFVLIHPSNTEPIIRVISEAKRKSLARVYCEATAELVRLVVGECNFF